MSEPNWSIAIDGNEIARVTGFTHTSGLLIDPAGNVAVSVELQPTLAGGVKFRERTDRIDEIEVIAGGLNEDAAKEIFDQASAIAIDELQGTRLTTN